MVLVDLKQSNLEEACKLFAASYNHQRKIVPILDKGNASAEKIMPLLKGCLEKHPGCGVAVYDNGKMAGYMTGFYVDGLLGVHKGAYCGEWAHASVNENAFEIYRHMYQAIGQRWVENGCLTHVIDFMNYAHEAQDAFCWNGFGTVCVDAVRPVEPMNMEAPEGVHITQEKIYHSLVAFGG